MKKLYLILAIAGFLSFIFFILFAPMRYEATAPDIQDPEEETLRPSKEEIKEKLTEAEAEMTALDDDDEPEEWRSYAPAPRSWYSVVLGFIKEAVSLFSGIIGILMYFRERRKKVWPRIIK